VSRARITQDASERGREKQRQRDRDRDTDALIHTFQRVDKRGARGACVTGKNHASWHSEVDLRCGLDFLLGKTGMRERERERERETETDRQMSGERDRERDRATNSHKHTDRKDVEELVLTALPLGLQHLAETERQRETEREREAESNKQLQTHRP
jgi:hypothetical protein